MNTLKTNHKCTSNNIEDVIAKTKLYYEECKKSKNEAYSNMLGDIYNSLLEIKKHSENSCCCSAENNENISF